MKFGDQADNVQAQAEMRPAVAVPARPHARDCHSDSKSRPRVSGGDRRAGVVDFQYSDVRLEAEPDG